MKETREEIVALYKYVFHHPRSTFDEIAEKALPPAMRHTAYQTFRAYRVEQGEELPDEWFAIEGNKDLAWRWWVSELLRTSCNTNRFSVATQDGSRAQGKRRDQVVYSVKTPPQVKGPTGKMVAWSPDIDRAYEKHVRGMRVVDRVPQAIEGLKASSPTRKQLDAAIAVMRDALEALRIDWMPPSPR
jgi:hypothetical protein